MQLIFVYMKINVNSETFTEFIDKRIRAVVCHEMPLRCVCLYFPSYCLELLGWVEEKG